MYAQSLSRVQLFVAPWAGSSVHGLFQSRLLEQVAIFFSREMPHKEEENILKTELLDIQLSVQKKLNAYTILVEI